MAGVVVSLERAPRPGGCLGYQLMSLWVGQHLGASSLRLWVILWSLQQIEQSAVAGPGFVGLQKPLNHISCYEFPPCGFKSRRFSFQVRRRAILRTH
jgi:hypothetical protein